MEMNDLTCSPYLSHPPLTSREKRMLAALEAAQNEMASARLLVFKYSPDHHWMPHIDQDIETVKAVIAECHEAQGKPAPITDTYREFDGGDAA